MSSTVKTLFITHDGGMYGAQKCLLKLIEGLDRNFIEPYLLSPNRGLLTERCAALQTQVFIKPMHHWILPSSQYKYSYFGLLGWILRGLRSRVWAIATLAQRIGIDVIYTNTVTVLEGALAAHILRKPHIWHLHEAVLGNIELKSLLPQRVLNWIIAAFSDVRIINSRFIQRVYGIKSLEPNILLAYNGIDTKVFAPGNRASIGAVAKLPLPSDKKYALVVGAIHPRKGIETLLGAAQLLRTNHSEIHFLIVGDGEEGYVRELKAKVHTAHLDGNFHFLGWRENIPALMASADLLISASHQESFGLTVCEAMASGTPVVATRSGGPQEIIEDGISGILIPVNDPPSLARAIVDVLSNPNLAQHLRQNGMRRVIENFTVEKYVWSIQESILKAVNSYTPLSRS